jgi:hypothetical protein
VSGIVRDRIATARWTLSALRAVRSRLTEQGLDAASAPPAPVVRAAAEKTMLHMLRLSRETCLVKSLVRQSWYMAHGDERDLVIGITVPAEDFEAHAWLEGDDVDEVDGFTELVRRRPHAAL